MKNTIVIAVVQTSLNATFPIQPSIRPRLIADNSLTSRTSIKASVLCALILMPPAVFAAPSFFFSTGDPDGRMATGTRPASNGKIEIEAADDFALSQPTVIDH